MKLVTYRRGARVRHGYRNGADTVIELGAGDLSALIAATGDFTDWRPPDGRLSHPLGGLELLAPLVRPGKLLAVATNYQDHVTETGGLRLDKSRLAPRLFLMPPTAIAAPGAAIALPACSREIDWEGELAVIVGRTARTVPVERALSVVAGYAIANDVSARSLDYGYPRDTDDVTVGFFDWLAGKWPDGFAPLGPYLVTADEVGDPQQLELELTVNGTRRQRASTADMIFSVAELIAFASRLMTLEPGDVLLTGTPAGVGVATGEFLAPGDEMTVRITGLGALTNRVTEPVSGQAPETAQADKPGSLSTGPTTKEPS